MPNSFRVVRNFESFPVPSTRLLPSTRSGLVYVSMLSAAMAMLALSESARADRLSRNYTPPIWQEDIVPWSGDQDRNKIDDLIDGGGLGPFDIVVNFRECVTDTDMTALATAAAPGNIRRKYKYLSSVALDTVLLANVQVIAQWDNVAFIELNQVAVTTLDVSVPNICVSNNNSCAGNVDSLSLDGTGTNIVIMDTGVDNDHDTFSGTPFIGGYDAGDRHCVGGTDDGMVCRGDWECLMRNCQGTFGDPDDLNGHGTHVASIALGQGGANVSRGVARGAGLIDIKCVGTGYCRDALETVYDQHQNGTWTVHVINGSFGWTCSNHNGIESFSQLVDRAETLGIVFVAAAGNHGPNNGPDRMICCCPGAPPAPPAPDHGDACTVDADCSCADCRTVGLSSPAAATTSIAVAASHDEGFADRTDALADFSSRGPRADDGDADDVDELKPEVTAPGQFIDAARSNTADGVRTISGTSMAAPHVAGLAAILMQADPSMPPATVKDTIIRTSEDLAQDPSDPTVDDTWNRGWGWGLVNAFESASLIIGTDLTFPNHPANPEWKSQDVFTNFPPRKGFGNVILAFVTNTTAAVARDVRIHFSIHDYSASTTTFHHIGTQVVDISGNSNALVFQGWTPASDGHRCLKVEIAYGPDSDTSNNTAFRNLTVAESPVNFRVRNTLTEGPALIELVPSFEFVTDPPWSVDIDPPSVTLWPDDCPADITVLLTHPPEAPGGQVQVVDIAAMIGKTVIGGVSVQDSVPPVEPPELPGVVNGINYDIRKQRFLSVNPNNPTATTRMRLLLVDNGCSVTGKQCSGDASCTACDAGSSNAGEPCDKDSQCIGGSCVVSGETCEEQSPPVDLGFILDPELAGGDAPPNTLIAGVGADPGFRVWDEPLVHIVDCEVAPGRVYRVEVEELNGPGVAGLNMRTSPKPEGKDWGDIVGNFTGTEWTAGNFLVNVDDVSSIIKFLTLKPAPHVTRCEMLSATGPSFVNMDVSADELGQIIRCFNGELFPPLPMLLGGYPDLNGVLGPVQTLLDCSGN